MMTRRETITERFASAFRTALYVRRSLPPTSQMVALTAMLDRIGAILAEDGDPLENWEAIRQHAAAIVGELE